MRKSPFNALIQAIEAEPADTTTLVGASGCEHSFLAVGVDRRRRRLVTISGEPLPRIAALVQTDLQAADTSIHVVSARPIIVDIATVARTIQRDLGKSVITRSEWIELKEKRAELDPPGEALEDFVDLLDRNGFLLGVMGQVALATGEAAERIVDAGGPIPNVLTDDVFDLSHFTTVDILAADREFGICPIPLCSFSEHDLDLLKDENRVDDVRDLLIRTDVFQYFFPPPDQVALGMIDRARSDRQTLLARLETVPSLGHPFGATELLQSPQSLPDLIDALQERRFIVEGETCLELAPDGTTVRSTVRFKPREGLVSKLINRLSINVSLRDFFGPS